MLGMAMVLFLEMVRQAVGRKKNWVCRMQDQIAPGTKAARA